MFKIEEIINKIHCADCLEFMEQMPDKCVDLVVTSPPYDNLRDYEGYKFDFNGIAKELFRILNTGGIVVWVVGDEVKNFCESLTSFKQAIFFVDDCGFNLLDTMIYYKQNYAPAYPIMRRYANQFEYMFVFSKGKPRIFNPIQKLKVRNKKEVSTFRQKNGSLIKKVIEKGRETKDASNVWEYAVGGNLTGHPGVFPIQLVKDHIFSWSDKGFIVFDLFIGSGTTAIAAIETGRNFIGVDIEPKYCEMAEKRIRMLKKKPELKDIENQTSLVKKLF